jgi:predicted DNA-binding transcriptional regulator AlpA
VRDAVILPAPRNLAADGLGATEIAKRLGIGRAGVYRLMTDRAA